VKKSDQNQNRLQNVFTACTAGISLLEPKRDVAENAAQMAVVLLSTAHSSFDEFQNARKCGQKLCIMAKSISWGERCANPNISGGMIRNLNRQMMKPGKCNFSFRGFLREKHETNNSTTETSQQKGRNSVN
jgi:hypothetical protein